MADNNKYQIINTILTVRPRFKRRIAHDMARQRHVRVQNKAEYNRTDGEFNVM